MPFGFNFGGSKQSQSGSFTGTDQYNKTSTPTNPDWVDFGGQDIFNHTQTLGNADPRSYVAGPDQLQIQAGDAASRLSGSPWNYDSAADLTRGASNTSWLDGYMNTATPQISGGKAYNYIDNYMNPYLNDVVAATSADLSRNEGQVRAQDALNLQKTGGLGGSGAAIRSALDTRELGNIRNTSLANLRSAGFNTALGAANNDADRATQARIANSQTTLQDRAAKVGFGLSGQRQQLDAGRQLADISSGYDANQRANIATQGAAGATLQQIQQAFAGAPLELQQWLTQNFSGLPLALYHGTTESGVDNQSGTSRGSTSGLSFGFSGGGK